MKILVISNNYSSTIAPNYGAFVYNRMQETAKSNDLTIITAFKVHNLFKRRQEQYGDERCIVYRPKYFSFSNKKVLGIDFNRVSNRNYKNAINRALKNIEKPDIIYCHFLSNAAPVVSYARSYKIPLVVASGESSYRIWNKMPPMLQQALHDQINHIICVSNDNRCKLINLGFDEKAMTVVPNAVDYNLFKPIGKKECREKLNLPKNKLTVGFIGHFIHRKAPNRIIDAIISLDDRDIHQVCVGNKGQLISNSFTTELAPVTNFQLPLIYSSFDLFVLPTLNEGHCNVIEEAEACGVPMVSSKGTSVEGQINESTSILVDPLNVDKIADAILVLKNDEERLMLMKQNLKSLRGENSLDEGASKINKILESEL